MHSRGHVNEGWVMRHVWQFFWCPFIVKVKANGKSCLKSLTFFSDFFCCPRSLDLPTPGGVFVHYYTVYSITHYTAYYPFLWVSVVRTRSGPGCLWHTSPTGNRTHNLGVLSIGFKLLPVLASIGSGISAWFILWFRDQLSVHHLQWNQGLSEFLSPPGFEPWPPLISTVNDLKAEGPLSESLRGVQLEVGQSAVVKPPFERE